MPGLAAAVPHVGLVWVGADAHKDAQEGASDWSTAYAEGAEVPSVKAEYSQGKEGIPTTDHILHRYIRPGAIRRASAREGK